MWTLQEHSEAIFGTKISDAEIELLLGRMREVRHAEAKLAAAVRTMSGEESFVLLIVDGDAGEDRSGKLGIQ